MALSDKVASGRFIVLEDFTPDDAKTKAAKRVIATAAAKVSFEKRFPSILVVLSADRRSAAPRTLSACLRR